MAESQLSLRQQPPPATGEILSVTRESAGWEYISFRVWRLAAGDRVSGETRNEEVGLVVLAGRLTVESPLGRWEDIGGRGNVFEGSPYVVYLPPGTSYTLDAVTDCEVAAGGCIAARGSEARLIRPEEIVEEIRGEGNAQRRVRHLLEADQPAEGIFLVEVITPSGNWSSYPPHKHDQNNPPEETYLEETYYHRVKPEQGFGFQRVYTEDGSLDESALVQDGTLVLVPKGYHTVAAAPGYEVYYLNVMGGPVREWRFRNDPSHAWVATSWKTYGAPARTE